jgi:preprotein translocase subunit SecA
MRRFAGPKVTQMLASLGLKDDEAIEHRWVTRLVERAQKKVEERNFDIRKRLLEFDEVMNEQRTLIYDYRQRILRAGGSPRARRHDVGRDRRDRGRPRGGR